MGKCSVLLQLDTHRRPAPSWMDGRGGDWGFGVGKKGEGGGVNGGGAVVET